MFPFKLRYEPLRQHIKTNEMKSFRTAKFKTIFQFISIVIAIFSIQNNILFLDSLIKGYSNQLQNRYAFEKLKEILQDSHNKVQEQYSKSQINRLTFIHTFCKRYVKDVVAKKNVCPNSLNIKDILDLGVGISCAKEVRTLTATKTAHYDPRWSWVADLDRKYMFCIPPNTAGTTWQRMYLAIKNQDLNYLDPEKDAGDWESYIYSQAPRLLQLRDIYGDNLISLVQSDDYKRIIATRHPFDRLYSAWKDKFRRKKPELNANQAKADLYPHYFTPKA